MPTPVLLLKSHPALFPGPKSRAQAEAGNYAKRRISWRGLTLRVENEAGTVREGNGWQTRMVIPYGEVEDSLAVDGDRLDVYIGPDLETATHVYVVEQRRAGRWSEYDEPKCMLGFLSEESAAAAYLQHYDDARFMGGITAMPVDEFVARARGSVDNPSLVKSWLGGEDLLKATVKKMITVPGYVKTDGTWVPPHQKAVHYNADHQLHQVAHGGVSHSQKQAHAKLSKHDWFQTMPVDDKAAHVMAHATDIQDAASASAAVSMWKAAAKAGKNPTAPQWAAFQALPAAKKAALYDEVSTGDGFGHLKPPEQPAEPAKAEVPAAPPPTIAELEHAKPKRDPAAAAKKQMMADADADFIAGNHIGLGVMAEEATHGYPEVAAHAGKHLANLKAKDALAQIPKSGSHYQKEALKKIQADPAWLLKEPAAVYADVMALYKELQGAASHSAAVSMWKKAVLAGKYPSAAQAAAFKKLNDTDPKKAWKLYDEVVASIGHAKMGELMAGSDVPSPTAAAAPAPAPVAQEADADAQSAYDYLSSNVQHVPIKQLAKEWLADDASKGVALVTALQKMDYDSVQIEAIVNHATGWTGGPKEGDTKPGADGGTLVLKDGHWVKQGDDAPSLEDKPLSAAIKEAMDTLAVSKAWDALVGIVETSKQKAKVAYAKELLAMKPPAPIATHSGMPPALDVPAYDYIAKNTGADHSPKVLAEHWLEQNPDGGADLSEALQSLGYHFLAANMDLPAPDDGDAGPEPEPQKPAASSAGNYAYASLASLVGITPTSAAIAEADKLAKAGDVDGLEQQQAGLGKLKKKTHAALGLIIGKVKTAKLADAHGVNPDLLTSWYQSMVQGVNPGASLWDAVKQLPDGAETTLYGITLMASPTALGGEWEDKFKQLQQHWNAAMKAPAPAPAKPPRVASVKPVATPAPVKKYPKTATVYHNTSGGHNKQWSVSKHGKELITSYGPIGKKQQTTVKTFANPQDALAAMQQLKKEKQKGGYIEAPGIVVNHAHTSLAQPTAAAGPKDGDTKQGADGMLVFKDGHWHKVPQAAKPLGLDAINAAKAAAYGSASVGLANQVSKDAAAMAAKGDLAGIEALLANPANYDKKPKGKKFLDALHAAMTGGGSTAAASPPPGTSAAFVAAATGAKPAPAPAAPPKPAPSKSGNASAPKIVSVQELLAASVSEISDWKKVGGQQGSNEGGTFKDGNGVEWYCKFPKNAGHAASEILASKLYAAAGLDVPELKAITLNGKAGIASRVVPLKQDAAGIGGAAGMKEGFAVDAWLANWDVVGPDFTNTQLHGKKAFRVDVGGALEYRAQGTKKTDFGAKVLELDSLRDKGKNPSAAKVFGGMTDAQIASSARNVFKLSDDSIRKMVKAYGPGSDAEKTALANTLIARKADLMARFPQVAADYLPKSQVVIPPSPNFKAWNGPGQGLSSKVHVNQQNQDLADEIHGLGVAGKAKDLKGFEFQPIDKETGAPVGAKQPIATHMSGHVKKYHGDVLHAATNPVVVPSPLVEDAKVEVDSGKGVFGALLKAFDDVKTLLQASHKLGRYAITGKVDGGGLFDGWNVKEKSHKSGAISAQKLYDASKKKFDALSSIEKQAIKDYTGSSYTSMNNAATGVGSHGKTDYAIAGVSKASVDLEEGTVLSRKFSFGSDADLQKMLQSEGCVIKDFGIISTAMTSGTWSGGVHLRITTAPGCKGLFVAPNPHGGGGAISVNPYENEVILPYGTKFFVKKVHPPGSKFTDEHGSWGSTNGPVIEVIALPQDA